jgi:hypothetical protein
MCDDKAKELIDFLKSKKESLKNRRPLRESLDGDFGVYANRFLENIRSKKLNDTIDNDLLDSFNSFLIRSEALNLSGFPIYTREWMEPLSKVFKCKTVLEVMAGCGAFSYYMKNIYNIECICTGLDITRYASKIGGKWLDVEQIDASDAIEKYKDVVDFVFMSWPDLSSPSAINVVNTLKKVDMDIKLIYIGEGHGGCTASDDFFDNVSLSPIPNVSEKYKSWGGIHDEIYFVKYK